MLYYAYCIKMNRPEEEFFRSSTKKILRMIEIQTEGVKPKVQQVYSMRDFLA